MTITAMDVRKTFNVTQDTRYRFNGWFRDRTPLVERVMSHAATAVLRVTPDDVRSACASLPSADRPPDVPEIRQWRPEFPFTQVAHHVVERLGRLPVWDEFREFCESDEPTRAMLWTPAAEAIASTTDRALARDAMRHKVVGEFADFLRYLSVIAHLRQSDLDVRVHPLADLVFDVDAWAERLILNPRGGAHRSARLLIQAMPPFFFHDLAIADHEQVGCVTLPSRHDLDRAARSLRRILYPDGP
ncbi:MULTISPECIES: hypothetical protein [unclassified Saccharothrix]|uniref:hypothetical protein n=1 Tax=unclassified Saccharothrix TaxID=2593673 RepID=UPI00307E14FE